MYRYPDADSSETIIGIQGLLGDEFGSFFNSFSHAPHVSIFNRRFVQRASTHNGYNDYNQSNLLYGSMVKKFLENAGLREIEVQPDSIRMDNGNIFLNVIDDKQRSLRTERKIARAIIKNHLSCHDGYDTSETHITVGSLGTGDETLVSIIFSRTQELITKYMIDTVITLDPPTTAIRSMR